MISLGILGGTAPFGEKRKEGKEKRLVPVTFPPNYLRDLKGGGEETKGDQSP